MTTSEMAIVRESSPLQSESSIFEFLNSGAGAASQRACSYAIPESIVLLPALIPEMVMSGVSTRKVEKVAATLGIDCMSRGRYLASASHWTISSRMSRQEISLMSLFPISG